MRLMRAGFVITREGLLEIVPTERLPRVSRFALSTLRFFERSKTKQTAARQRLSRGLTKLGPSWVKLGQFLATRPDVVGAALSKDLEHLQDKVAPFSQSEAEQILSRVYQKPVGEVFASFGPPVAAASIAQVHKAQIVKDGVIETVAVKILRPGVEARFARDLETFSFAAQTIERFIPFTRRLKPRGVVETLRATTAMELDLRLEAAALSEMADNTKADEGFVVPRVEWPLTAQNVLVMEWIDGIPLSDLPALQAAGCDLKNLARILLQSFLRHALRDGFFHADMHQGNVFVDRQGRIAAVDFGITGRLGANERRFLAEILWSFINRDYLRGADVHFDAGYVPPRHSREQFAQALRAIGEPIQQKRASDISMARVLSQLFEYTQLFDMETQLSLVLLQKTMVVTEGVARTLDPDLDIWAVSKPVVSEWMRDNLGIKGQLELAKRSGQELARIALGLPEHLQKLRQTATALSAMAEHGVVLSDETVKALGKTRDSAARWQAAALWVIAIGLVVLVWRHF